MNARPKLFAGLTQRSLCATRTGIRRIDICADTPEYALVRRSNVYGNVCRPARPRRPPRTLTTTTASAISSKRPLRSFSIDIGSKRTFSSTPCSRASLDDDESFDDFEENEDDAFGGLEGPQRLDNLLRQRQRGRSAPAVKVASTKEALRAREREVREKRLKEAKDAKEAQRRRAETAKPPVPQISLEFLDRIARVDWGVSSVSVDVAYLDFEYHVLRFASKRAKKIDNIARKFSLFDFILQDTTDELLLLKYSGFDKQISQCAESLQNFRDQYVALKFENLDSFVSAIDHSIRYVKRQNWIFKNEMLWRQVHFWMESTSGVVRELDHQFISPRKSARRNINRLLDQEAKIHIDYIELKQKMEAVLVNVLAMKSILISLLRESGAPASRVRFYSHLCVGFNRATANLWQDAHAFRLCFLRRRTLESPFAAAMGLESTMSRVYRSRSRTLIQMARDFPSLASRNELKNLPNVVPAFRRALSNTYMRDPPIQPPRSPNLDIRWRQLDVLAPFQTVMACSTLIGIEVRYLASTFHKDCPMWPRINETKRLEHKFKFQRWAFHDNDIRGAFSAEYSTYRGINWLRLRQENKLHALGEPDRNRERGLFMVRYPLSQDPSRFYSWADHLSTVLNAKACMTDTPWIPPSFWLRAERKRAATMRKRYNKNTLPGYGIQDLGSANAEADSAKLEHRQGRTGRISSRTSIRARHVASPRRKLRASRLSEPDKSSKPSKSGKSGRSGSCKASRRRAQSAKKVAVDRAIVNTNNASNRTNLKDKSPVTDVPRPPTHSPVKSGNFPKPPIASHARTKGMPESSRINPDKPNTNLPRPPVKSNELPKGKGSAWSGSDKTRQRRHDFVHTSSPESGTSSSPFHGHRSSSKRFYSSSLPRWSVVIQAGEAKGNNNSNNNVVNDDNSGFSMPRTSASVGKEHANGAGQDEAGMSTQQSRPGPAPYVTEVPMAGYWSLDQLTRPHGKRAIIHYCRSFQSAEKVAQYFHQDEIVGFDMEWKAHASSQDSIQDNLSLIQIANEERVALFQLALFKPARTVGDLVPPSLQRLLETPKITKVGVSIKADCTRLRKHLGFNARGIFEASHLYKLVKYYPSNQELINKRPVSLSDQVEEHLGLLLNKGEDVRCGDWSRVLDYRQVQYAATDAYACLCLFNVMEAKRKAMIPTPPRPAHAELDLPIRCVPDATVSDQRTQST